MLTTTHFYHRGKDVAVNKEKREKHENSLRNASSSDGLQMGRSRGNGSSRKKNKLKRKILEIAALYEGKPVPSKARNIV